MRKRQKRLSHSSQTMHVIVCLLNWLLKLKGVPQFPCSHCDKYNVILAIVNLFLQSATLDSNGIQLYSRFWMCPIQTKMLKQLLSKLFLLVELPWQCFLFLTEDHICQFTVWELHWKKGKQSLKFTRTDMLQLHIAQTILGRMEIEKKAAAISL